MRTLSLQNFRNTSPESRKNDYCGFVYSDDGNKVTVFEHGEETQYREAVEAFVSRMRAQEEGAEVEDEFQEVESDPIVSVLVSEAEQSEAAETIVLNCPEAVLPDASGDMLHWVQNYNGATPTAGELVDAIKYLLEFLKNS